jgi:heme-degrading monooxygenase HmoA
MEERLLQLSREFEGRIPGLVREYVYRTDADPNEYFLAVLFESRETYEANATTPEQHARYLQYRELLEADPEWHDGEVVYTYRS